MDYLGLLMRLLHIGSAMVLVGGLVYIHLVMRPALKLVEEGLRDSLLTLAHRRFMRLAHPAMLLLVISGAYNWTMNAQAYRAAGPMLHGLLGMKVLAALAVFSLLIAQAVGALRNKPLLWGRINLALVAAVVILAALVRHLHLEATP